MPDKPASLIDWKSKKAVVSYGTIAIIIVGTFKVAGMWFEYQDVVSTVLELVADMDILKEVNTLHGHAMGSQTLHEVSVRIRSKIRKFDKLFRFGGDEFCIVLPETEWHGALEVAERVCDAISSKPFLAREVNEGKGVSMSASLGIASFPLHARSRATLIQRADRAMQKIKKTTKNAIGISEIEEQDDDE